MDYSYALNRWSYGGHLAHYGIKGQQWGVRRFQNEDGTLTEEGKARYYDSLSNNQKKLYDKFSTKDQALIEKKMGEGKSFTKASQETANRRRSINNLKVGAIATAVSIGRLLYTYPWLRTGLKQAMLTTVSKAVNTKAIGGTLLKAKKIIDHLKMRKAGAVFVKAKDVWISGDKLVS